MNKKNLLLISLFGIVYLPLPICPQVLASSEPSVEESLEDDDVGAVKEVQIKVNQEIEEIAAEKVALASEEAVIVQKKERLETLAQNVAMTNINPNIIEEQLSAIKKRKDVVDSKQLLLERKVDAYSKIVGLVERKLEILGDETFSFQRLGEELKIVEKNKGELLQEQRKLEVRVKRLESVGISIQKNLRAKKFIAQIKGEDQETQASLSAMEQRLRASQEEVAATKDLLQVFVVRQEVINNYTLGLSDRRAEKLRDDFLVPSKLEWSLTEILLLAAVAGSCVFVWLLFGFRPKPKEDEVDTKKERIKFKTLCVLGLLGVFVYLCAAGVGYHLLARYAGIRLLKLFALCIMLLFVYRSIHAIICKVLSQRNKTAIEDSEDVKTEHPFIAMFETIFGWGLVLAACCFALYISGFEREGFMLVRDGLRYDFLKMGDVRISILGIIKVSLILWIFVVLARFLNNFLTKSVYPRLQLDLNMRYTLGVMLKYLMVIFGMMAGLNAIGVGFGILTVFAGTLGIGIGFGLQDIAKNFISGVFLLFERPIKIGDFIDIGGLVGKVRAVKARSTIVDTLDNIAVVVPNAQYMSEQVINWSYSDRNIRVHCPVGVAYGSDTELTKASLLEVAAKHPKVLNYPKPGVWFEAFGDNSLNFNLLIWINEPENMRPIVSEINFMIDELFREKKITIAFPQRDLHLQMSPAIELLAQKKT